jgi:CheY-like chemotaxis protein
VAPRITVVNDNPEFLDLVHDILEGEAYATTMIDGDKDDALERIIESRPQLLLIDLRMGTDRLHGWGVAQRVRKEPLLAGLPVILCSADVVALRDLAADLAQTKHVLTLPKPFTIDELTRSIDRLLAEAAAS